MLWTRLRSLAKNLRRRAQLEGEMAEELQFHLETRANDLMLRRRLSKEEAMRQARLEFGSIERYKEEGRESRGFRFFDELRGDLRFSIRQIRRNRGFAATVVLILAIGIGGNVAVFTPIHDALL